MLGASRALVCIRINHVYHFSLYLELVVISLCSVNRQMPSASQAST